MPFRHLYRQHESSHDFHAQTAFQGQHSQLAIVDPDSVDYTGWHEMDFTTTPLTASSSTLAAQKYSTAMDRDQVTVDPLAYLRSTSTSQHRHSSSTGGGNLINPLSGQTSVPRRTSGDLYQAGNQYSFSQLLNMEANLPPSMDHHSSGSRADDDSNMTNSDLTTTTTTLSASDSVNSSPPMNNLDPIAISIASRAASGGGDSSEKLCPLIAGQVDSCQPSRCGPDAPCMNFTTLPPIEECTSVPCITESPNSRNEIMITSADSMSVELHQRPSLSARTSNTSNSTPTSRSSVTPRRSSSNSTTTTTDIQPDVVQLPPRKLSSSTTTTIHSATASRRQTRATHKPAQPYPPARTTSVSSEDAENDLEEDMTLSALPSGNSSNNNKPTAPSKADAKQRAKQAHSLVERKYRENLNAKITQLHSTLQNSHYGPRVGYDDPSMGVDGGRYEDPGTVGAAGAAGNAANSKVRKSDVLTEAMNYVNQTEVEMRHMENEINRLTERVRILEKLVRCEDCSLLKQMVNLQVQAV